MRTLNLNITNLNLTNIVRMLVNTLCIRTNELGFENLRFCYI